MKFISALFLFLFVVQAHAGRDVLFVHGLGTPSFLYEKNRNLREVFEEQGYTLHVAPLPAQLNADIHTPQLYEYIRAEFGDKPFHIIAHSLGGILSRKVIQDYSLENQVLSLTTMATPHRGSIVADWALQVTDDPNSRAVDKKFANLLMGGDKDTAVLLSQNYMTNVFNKEYPNYPNIKYYSMGFYIPENYLLYTQNPFIISGYKIEKNRGVLLNDGFVSVSSARWGEYLGTFKADHWAETTPARFAFKSIYRDFFRLALDNLDKNFSSPARD